MNDQQTTVQHSKKKTLPISLLLAIIAVCSVVVGVIVYFCSPILTLPLELILLIVSAVVTLIGFIPIIGLLFNILSFVIFPVGSLLIDLIGGAMQIIGVVAVIAAIVVGIVALILSFKKTNGNINVLSLVLSIVAVVLGVLALLAIVVMFFVSLIVGIFAGIVGFYVSILFLAASAISLGMG